MLINPLSIISTVFVFDIDGTVCDSMPRVKKICEKHGLFPDDHLNNVNWTDGLIEDLFPNEETVMLDPVIPGSDTVIKKLNYNSLVFLTAREEMHRDLTRKWLSHKLGICGDVPLLMKPDGEDRGRSTIYKKKMFKRKVYHRYGGNSFVFFDDDVNTLKMYSQFGMAFKAPECWNIMGHML